jgi:hypothetical protein
MAVRFMEVGWEHCRWHSRDLPPLKYGGCEGWPAATLDFEPTVRLEVIWAVIYHLSLAERWSDLKF